MICRRLNIILCFLVVLFLNACQSTIPVKDAQDIVLKYHGTEVKVPPRGLGEEINNYIERYKEPDGNYSITTSIKRLFPTRDVIKRFGSKKNGWTIMRRQARYDFYQGNIETAIKWSDAAIRSAEYRVSKVICIFDKARFQAEAGNFHAAQKTLQLGNSIFMDEMGSGKYKDKRWLKLW